MRALKKKSTRAAHFLGRRAALGAFVLTGTFFVTARAGAAHHDNRQQDKENFHQVKI